MSSTRNILATWVKQGDRSHPNLVQLDSLDLSYSGWKEDVTEAEAAHIGMTFSKFEEKLWEIQEKQRIHDGNRTHPHLVQLDSLELSYPNWKADYESAMDHHIHRRNFNFAKKVSGMQAKQRMFEGDRSDPALVALDGLELSYPGHKDDIVEAEEAHTGCPFATFDDKITEMMLKQAMHDGDRSHPRLVALDGLQLSYPGWRDDVANAEEEHVRSRCHNFRAKLEGMTRKQDIYNGDRSHQELVLLDSLQLTYPGWEADVLEAENSHTRAIWTNFGHQIFKIQQKQMMHEGDRSHPRLRALDALHLSYPDWQHDCALAENDHLHSWTASFQKKMNGMKEKQRIYTGFQSVSSSSRSFSSPLSRLEALFQADATLADCIVCSSKPRTHAFAPCGHLCICKQCITPCNGSCPICRSRNTTRQLVPILSSSKTLQNKCVLCLDRDVTHAFVPCGHLAVCSRCVPSDHFHKECPVCHSHTNCIMKIFVS